MKAFCKVIFLQRRAFIAWKVAAERLPGRHEKESEWGQKSLWPAAKGNTAFRENECRTWDWKLITREKLYPFFPLCWLFFSPLPPFFCPVSRFHTLLFLRFLMRPYRGALVFLIFPSRRRHIVHAKHLGFDWRGLVLSLGYLIGWRARRNTNTPLISYLIGDSEESTADFHLPPQCRYGNNTAR